MTHRPMRANPFAVFLLSITAVLILAACGGDDGSATRTPVPTWTATPQGAGDPAIVAQDAVATVPPIIQEPVQPPAEVPVQPTPVPEVVEPTPVPPTPEPPTVAPTDTPALPTDTPVPTVPPTDTPTPEPTPTPVYLFDLETAEKLPTEALAANVVRIWVYAYSPSEFGLEGFSVRVLHEGAPLTVEEQTTAGVPQQTRAIPGPWTRFTNMNILFVEPQEGTWEVQLVDAAGAPAGPPATFTLTADETTRELYVRYRQR